MSIFKIIDKDSFCSRIDDPVFPDAVFLIIVKFFDVIIGSIAGRDDFDNEIRGTIAAFSIQFIFVTDDHQIRLYNDEGII